MANLCHFTSFHSLSSRKFSFSSHLPSLNSAIADHHRCRHAQIFACSGKPPRGKRNTKSVEDLCADLREFLSTVGLPENHVPTTKELSQHGRQDLANVVRRRGYKFIGQLLSTSSAANVIESDVDMGQAVTQEVLTTAGGQNEKLSVSSDDIVSNETIHEEDLSGCVKAGEELNPDDQSLVPAFLSDLALQEKVAKFIQHGELDTVEDSRFGVTNENNATDETLNGSVPKTSDQKIEDSELENLAEVKRLRFLLHQKELELTQLKEQIEKEKHASSLLQTKAETEITKAQKLISEKETELQSAEETLSGLKEVEIQYSGDGDTVEVAGSFNGWHQKISMEPQESSTTTDSTGSRSRLWRAVLWLYPGVYEIKFVVDGSWKVDPEMESVSRNSVHNNVLRVDR